MTSVVADTAVASAAPGLQSDEGALPRRMLLRGPRRWLRWGTRAAIAMAVYGLVIVHAMPEFVAGPWYIPSWREFVARLEQIPAPPKDWSSLVRADDRLDVEGVPVAYWGRPDARYGTKVTKAAKAPVAIVVHFTDDTPAVTLVNYGHRSDLMRGNGAFGYHFYIDAAGRVLQGAPLSVRTNHIKPTRAPERAGRLAHLDGSNTIGVTLIGACYSPPLAGYRCNTETPTRAQLASGLAIIAALQSRFGIPCAAVFGHGELQSDRKSFEGRTLSEDVRRGCSRHPVLN